MKAYNPGRREERVELEERVDRSEKEGRWMLKGHRRR